MLTWLHRLWVRLKLPRNQLRMPRYQRTSCQRCQPLSEKMPILPLLPRLHRVTRGADTLGTRMLCLWCCQSRGSISLVRVSGSTLPVRFFLSSVSQTVVLYTSTLFKSCIKTCMSIKQVNGKIMSSNWLYKKTGRYSYFSYDSCW